MRSQVEGLLRDIASAWVGPRITVHIIGSTALMLQTPFSRQTKDSDILEATGLDDDARRQLLKLGGPDTTLATKWSLHVQVVMRAIPFLPRPACWQPIEIAGLGDALSVAALSVTDVVVSKLKRFDARDRNDIDAMIRGGHVVHGLLVQRFSSAFDQFLGDARADDLPRYIENLNQVERDMFGRLDESEFELPEWIDDGS